jgi:hypothetical protein
MMLPDDAVLQIFNIQFASLRRRESATLLHIQKAQRAYEGEAGCLAVLAYHHMGHQC